MVMLLVSALWVLPASALAQIFVASSVGNTVGEYNASTGAVINANFITGLSNPRDIVVYGSDLLVISKGSNTIGRYNASTGAAVNANFITGLDQPATLAVSGSVLYVSNQGTGTVDTYNANTGSLITAGFVSGFGGWDIGIAVGAGGLYIANNLGEVGLFDPNNGSVSGVTPRTGFAALQGLLQSGGYLYASGGSKVSRFDAFDLSGTGADANFIIGLSNGWDLTASGSDLFVVDNAIGSVRRYDVGTGTLLNASFITGISGATGIALIAIPEPATWGLTAGIGAALLTIARRRFSRKVV